MLKAIPDSISDSISQCKYLCPEKKTIAFVRDGEKHSAAVGKKTPKALCSTSNSKQELKVDLVKQLTFPELLATS